MPFGLWNSKKVQPTIDRQRQVDMGYAARRLEQGDLSLTGADRGEPIFFDGIALLEPRVARAAESGIRGRIARGLYFYVPQPQAAEPAEELAEADRGTLTISSEGIAFAGRTRRIGVGFGAIESMSHGQDGIAIIARTAHRLHFGSGGAVVTIKVQDRIYKEPLSGTLLRLIVEAAMKASLGGG
jgi:hypothetical protein